MDTSLSIHFAPLLPALWLWVIVGAATIMLAASAFFYKRGLFLRCLTFVLFIVFLLNPALLEEEREAVQNVAIIVLDESQSQAIGARKERSIKALDALQARLAKEENIDTRVIRAPTAGGIQNETRLFDALDQALTDIPRQRRAGVFLITDGQVHDVPVGAIDPERYGPVHVLLSGEKNEKDRQVVITQAPAYGIVGQDVTLHFKIEDTGNITDDIAAVTYTNHDGFTKTINMQSGEEESITVPVTNAGQNVFEISTKAFPGELTETNNRAAILVNGVRDRLKVLLVSGQPHAGGRTWRDLLTSDPGVDLVHFTILREPHKLDATPQNELALIAFPFRELFEIKLYDFDLIIFDRYRLNRILPLQYFSNIAKYVEQGGALLESSGPSYAGADSIYNTPLMKILPGTPTSQIIKTAFKPEITEAGTHHPVTQGLHWTAGQSWGSWLRQVAVSNVQGDVLMNGVRNEPLLILNRVGKGRVAQITSDHIWLWSRGYDGGGPHAEMLRRVVHWLMKEPELDEKALRVLINSNDIKVSTPLFNSAEQTVTMTKPDGTTERISLENKDGVFQKTITADQLGIYNFEDTDGQKHFAVIGDLNPPELRGVKTTEDLLRPVVESTKGGMIWLDETAAPSLRMISGNFGYAGRGWLGLRDAQNYNVTGVKTTPILPAWLIAMLLLGIVTITWWREGKSD